MTRLTAWRGRSRMHPDGRWASRSRRPSTAHRLLGIAALATAATVVGACGAAGTPAPASYAATTAPPASPATGTPASALAPSPSAAALQSIDASQVGLYTNVMLSGLGAVWAASDDGLLRVSATGTPDAIVAGSVPDVAIGATDVYAIVAGDTGTDTLVEVDPTSGRTLRHWGLAPAAKSVVVADRVAYVAHATHPMTIDRIDLSTGKLRTASVTAAQDGASTFQSLAAGAGLIWATDGTTVVGLDPTDLSVHETVHPTLGVEDIWYGDGGLWVASAAYHGGVARIDPATGAQAVRVALDAVQVAFSAHGVWLSASDGPIEIDPTTGVVLATLPETDPSTTTGTSGIAVIGDEVWVDRQADGVLERIKVP